MAPDCIKSRGEPRRVRGEFADSLGRDRGASLAEAGFFVVVAFLLRGESHGVERASSDIFMIILNRIHSKLAQCWFPFGVSLLSLWGSIAATNLI